MNEEKESDTGKFSIEICEEKNFCKITLRGKIDFKSTSAFMSEVSENPRVKPYFNVLIDLIEVDYYPTYNEMMRLKDKLITLKHHFLNKLALITLEKNHILAELITVFSQLKGLNMKAFTDIKYAQAWLNEK